MKIHAYLNFAGTAEAAFRFYGQVLGGTLTEIHRFGSMPPQDGFQLTMTAEVCAIDQWTTSSAGRSVIPQSFVDAIGLTERTVTLEPSESGYRYRCHLA